VADVCVPGVEALSKTCTWATGGGTVDVEAVGSCEAENPDTGASAADVDDAVDAVGTVGATAAAASEACATSGVGLCVAV